MPDPIFVEGGILVPAHALQMSTSRSSGPGGQNVNKVASKVELRVDLAKIQGLDPEARQRLHRLIAKRLDGEGRLVVTSARSREQYRNLVDARRKVHDWIAKASVSPRRRQRTQPTDTARERRLTAKHRLAERKAERKTPLDMEE